MSYQAIDLVTTDGVSRLTLNRPEALNALNAVMLVEIREALAALVEAGETRLLVLAGAGKAFCSGADLAKGTGAQRDSGPFDAGRVLEDYINPLIAQIGALPFPVMSVVHGAAAGAGCALALAADVVLASRTAYFLMAFSKVGLVPDSGATWLLPRLVGLPRATAMLMLGDRVTAEQAAEWGLIYRAVDEDALDTEQGRIAERLASGPTMALGLLRRALANSLESTFAESLQGERDNQRIAGLTADFTEGVAAFREKRSARFTGR